MGRRPKVLQSSPPDNRTHVIRIIEENVESILKRDTRSMFYYQLDDNTFGLIDNRTGKKKQYFYKTFDEMVLAADKME